MDNRRYYKADCRKVNREAVLTNPGAKMSHAEKLLDKILPGSKKNTKSLPVDAALFQSLTAIKNRISAEVNWEENLADASYVVFDTETTGLHPFKDDEIISLGAVRLEKGLELKERFHRLVNPARPVSAKISRLTGITEEMLQDQPDVYSILLRFLDFTGPSILVAHNACFDLAFINLKLGECDLRIINPVIDTAMLTAAFYPNLGEYSLEYLARLFDLDLSLRHTALGDALITANLFMRLLPKLLEQGVTDLQLLEKLLVESEKEKGYPHIF